MCHLEMINVVVLFMSFIYYWTFWLQILRTIVFSKIAPLFKLDKGLLSTQTGLVLSFIPHVPSFTVIIILTILIKHFKSVPSNLYRACADRNTAMAIELFPKMAQLYDFLSALSRRLAEFPVAPSQTILLHSGLLT